MVKKILFVMSIALMGILRAEPQSGDASPSAQEPPFYVEQSFFDVASLLEASEEMQKQFDALSPEDKAALIAIFEQFNEDIQKVFHALAPIVTQETIG